MWYFDSPHVIFGEDALSFLAQLTGQQAFVITAHLTQFRVNLAHEKRQTA
jgi:hypothetical protein